MEKEMLGNMFKYEDGKLYKKYKSSKNIWRCLTDNKPKEDGYIRCHINNKKHYYLQRLVYLFHNPDWNIHDNSSNNLIDHMNENKLDNRIENLMRVNKSENCQNVSIRNGKEVKGYYFRNDGRPKPWIVNWRENDKQKSKGFKTEIEAKDFAEEMRKLHYYRPCKK